MPSSDTGGAGAHESLKGLRCCQTGLGGRSHCFPTNTSAYSSSGFLLGKAESSASLWQKHFGWQEGGATDSLTREGPGA